MPKKDKKVLLYCNGKKCCKYNKEVKNCLLSLVEKTDKKLKVKETKCMGSCKKAPIICIKKDICLTNANESSLKDWFNNKIG